MESEIKAEITKFSILVKGRSTGNDAANADHDEQYAEAIGGLQQILSFFCFRFLIE